MSNKYYRFMETPEKSWKPYREMPMYDEHPELGSYNSTMFLTSPQKGDYLIQNSEGELYVDRPTDPEHFADVSFLAMPSLQDLLKTGIVVEAPQSIVDLDYKLQNKLEELDDEILHLEDHLENLEQDMQERRFGFPTKAAREAKQKYNDLKPLIFQNNKKFGEVGSQLHHLVIAPLKELQKQQKNTGSLDGKISRASEQTQQAHGQGMGLTMGKENGHDR